MAQLSDAVEFDMATNEEALLLKEWKKYRVILNRVDISKAPEID
ncbi:tail fiber assembly protein [Photorhabdus tasmaniensis]